MSDISSHNEYQQDTLSEADLATTPFEQLVSWLDVAADNPSIAEPNAMVLATASGDGIPSARVVLLRGIDERGLVFYTNYESRKGYELAQNNRVAVVFFWPQLQRQVRVEGDVDRVDGDESDEYFAGRPHDSKLGAIISNQSAVIQSREGLEVGLEKLRRQYPNETDVPRPSNWGGYRIVPDLFEFWQGRRSRLHDRLQYRRQHDDWIIERLSP